MARLTLAAQHYPDRWPEFIRDSSEQTPYYKRRGKDFSIGYKYLVRFLLLVGQRDLALAITDQIVKTLVSEVTDQPIPDAKWLRTSSSPAVAMDFLFERLNWPIPMVRWRAARKSGISSMRPAPETQQTPYSFIDLRPVKRRQKLLPSSQFCSWPNPQRGLRKRMFRAGYAGHLRSLTR